MWKKATKIATILGGGLTMGCGNVDTNPVIPVLTSPSPSPGALSAAPASISLYTPGGVSSPTSTKVTVSESGYSGPITANASNCSGPGSATVSPASGTGPSATFTISSGSVPTLATPCTVSFSDNHGDTTSVSVTVNP